MPKKIQISPRIYMERRDSGNISYRVFYTLLGRKKTRRFKTQAEAERFREYLTTNIPSTKNEWQLSIDPNELTTIVKMIMRQKHVTEVDDVYACLSNNLIPNLLSHKTLAEAALEFAEVKSQEGRRDNLLTQYETVLSGLTTHMSKSKPLVSDCTESVINKFLSGKRPGGKKHTYTLLRAFFRWCINRKYIQQSPLENIILPKTPRKDNFNASIIHPIAMNILLEILKDTPALYHTFLLLSMTGMRPQELLPTTRDTKDTLRWNDIQPQTKAIRIRRDISKTHSASTIIGTPQRLWDTMSKIPIDQYQSNERVGVRYYYYKRTIQLLNKMLTIAYELFRKKGEVLLGTQSFTISRDILRHSFASYAIHTIGIPATALITRHSLQIMQSHYLGVATKEHADLYFNGCDVSDYIEYIRNKMDISIPPYSEYKRQSHPIMKRLISRK